MALGVATSRVPAPVRVATEPVERPPDGASPAAGKGVERLGDQVPPAELVHVQSMRVPSSRFELTHYRTTAVRVGCTEFHPGSATEDRPLGLVHGPTAIAT